MKKIKILIGVCSVVAALLAFFPHGLALLFHLSPAELFSRGRSIGVIGGADGPTQIFISRGGKMYDFSVLFGSISALGVLLLAVLQGKGKRGKDQ